jgi:hypothetical protein
MITKTKPNMVTLYQQLEPGYKLQMAMEMVCVIFRFVRLWVC